MDKSDIVGKAASLHLQETIAMPDGLTPRKTAWDGSKTMMPVDDPVGTALRRLHDEVVAEPLPDDFLRLLAEIERKIDGAQATE